MALFSELRSFPRFARRCVGFARQAIRDLEWHRRYDGPAFPPRMRRVVEQCRLLVSNAITGEDYYNHGLYRSSMSWQDKRTFLGYFQQSRYYQAINPPVYDILARDKALFHTMADALGIPCPEIVATLSPGNGPSFGPTLKSCDDLAAFLSVPGRAHLFLKPVDGGLGEGALAIGERLGDAPAWRRLPSRDSISLDEVIRHVKSAGPGARFLVQRLLRPHPVMAEIVPDVCPTVRIMTLVADSIVVIGAVLRLGSGDSPTDNLSGGGVVVPIDPESGRLGVAVHILDGVPVRGRCHPVSAVEITGRVLPHWPQIVALARESAARMPYQRCLGWDIAVTDGEPVVVEVNTHSRCRPLQVACDRGMLAGPLGQALFPHNGITRSGLQVPDARWDGAPLTGSTTPTFLSPR